VRTPPAAEDAAALKVAIDDVGRDGAEHDTREDRAAAEDREPAVKDADLLHLRDHLRRHLVNAGDGTESVVDWELAHTASDGNSETTIAGACRRGLS
jgi:hypothetical protein